MYSIVLMAALTTGGDAADFGRRGCCGCWGGGGYCGGCYGGWGGCYGGGGGCHGCWSGPYSYWGGCHGCSGGWGGCYGGGGYGCSGGCYASWGYGCAGGYGCYGGCAYSSYHPTATYGGGYVSGPVTYDTAQVQPAATGQRARLIVTLPADATLTVDGQPTTQRTGRRVFTSPPLEPGRDYSYTLKAQVVRDGQRLTTTREVTVRAGRETAVSLDIPSGTAAVRR